VKLGGYQSLRLAEEYWRAGNRAAALLLWMELADAGNEDAAFNAGLALLELDEPLPFLTAELQKKLAVSMFKQLSRLSQEDVSVYLFRAYSAAGKLEKARNALAEMSSSSHGYYHIAQAHIDGNLAFKLESIVGNLSLAITEDTRFILPVILLSPRIIWATTQQIWRCLRQPCDQDEIDDLSKMSLSLWKRSRPSVLTLFALFWLIVFVRKRIARCYTE
jgi:hypothetical protein